MSLIHSLRNTQIDESIQQISGSPSAIREGKHYAQSERRADNTRGSFIVEMYSSPSKSNTADIVLDNSSEKSSPNQNRYKQIVGSPSWRRGENFVRQSRDQSEDPFITNTIAGQNPGQGRFLLITTVDEPRC